MKIDKTKPDRNISKRLSKVLRHAPEAMGLTLDNGGWVAVDQVLAGFARQGRSIDRDDLKRVVDTNDKKRFTLSNDGLRIRAAQGHSVNVDLGLNHAEPSAILYHGTAEANLAAIKRDGLKPQSRQQVHLSSDRDTARRVGARHGKPRILQVDTAKMVRAGHKFYLADNGVWLTDAVLPEYLSGF